MRNGFKLLLLSLIVAGCMFGQTAAMNGEISGTVTDPSGAAISGAKVYATNVDTGLKQTAVTGDNGLYRVPLLPLGPYSIEVQATGFGNQKLTGIVLSAGSTATVNVAMALSQASTTVEVSATGQVTEPSRIDLGNTLDENLTRNLPLVSRNPYNFILFQPNVSGRANTEFGVPRKVNANGFNGRINYQLDGSNNTESDRAGIRLIPISDTYVAEVQQVSNGFAPEFGNTVGTVFNTITKSGANDFHGEGSYIFRRTDMSAKPKLLSATGLVPDVNVDGYAVDGGGRVVKDHLFWFGSFEHVKRDLPGVVTVSAANIAALGLPAEYINPVPFRQSVYFYMAKGDWQINDRNRLSVRYLHHANDSPYNNSAIGGTSLISRSYNFVDRSHVGGVQLVSTLSASMVNELRGQVAYRGQLQNTFSGSGTGPAIVVSGVANFGGPTGAGFVYQETTPELTDNFSYLHGSHAFKVGGSLRWIRDTQVQAQFAQYTFASIATYQAAVSGVAPKGYTNFQQVVGNPSISYNSLFAGWFAQDTWKPVRNLTITYGIRYDVYKTPSADASAPFASSRAFRTDKNNFGPRFGFAWGLGKDQKTVIRASSGIFYDPFQTDQYRLALAVNGNPQYFTLSIAPSAAFAPAFPGTFTGVPSGATIPPDVTTVASDFSSLYSVNGNVSISRELAPSVSLTASYLYTAGNRLPVYLSSNLVPSGSFLADGRPIFGATKIYPQFGNVLVASSVAHSSYNGANLTIRKQTSHGLELMATYTWSHAIDNAPEQNNIDSGAFLPADPTNLHRERGDSLTDKRHVFNMTGVYAPEFKSDSHIANMLFNHNRLSVAVVGATGDAFNMASNQNLNKDNATSATYQRPLFIARNSIRGPGQFEMNARYSRLIPIGERRSAEFLVETTNLTNRLNVISLNSTATVDASGNITAAPSLAPTGSRDQRLLQIGLRFNW